MKNFFRLLSFLSIGAIFFSCATAPKLEGTYSSAVVENTIYFESERYQFKGKKFAYNFSTDMVGYDQQGVGLFEQDGYKTKLYFSEELVVEKTRATIIEYASDSSTFVITFSVTTESEFLEGVNILLSANGIKDKEYYTTGRDGKKSITVTDISKFPILANLQYIGFEPLTIKMDKPQNYDIKVMMEADVSNLITSTTKIKDIRQKGSYIYIDGKKFKKISE